MRKMLAELVTKKSSKRGYSIIGDNDPPPEKNGIVNRETTKSGEIEESLGVEKGSKKYLLLKKFIGIVRKRIKNIKTKRRVIEEMVETENSYI